jgi:hypothetical protein
LYQTIFFQPLAHFGDYMKQRKEKLWKMRQEKGALWDPTAGKIKR